MPTKVNASSTVRQGLAGAILPVGTTFEVRDVWNKASERIDPYQNVLMGYMNLNKRLKWTTTNNAQALFEFPERELVPNMDTVASVTSGAGTATLRLVGTEPNLYRKAKTVKIIMADGTEETGTVTNATSVYFDVLRDYDTAGAGQNWSTVTAGDKILFLGSAHGDKLAPPENVFMTGYMRKGRVQLFQETMSMTTMMQAVAMSGGVYGGDWWKQHLKDTMVGMKNDIESAMWHNENHQLLASNTYGSTEVIAKMEGAIYQITQNGGFSHTYGSGTLQKTALDTFFRMSKRGSSKKTFFVGDELAGQIEDLAWEKKYSTEPIKVFGTLAGEDVINILRIRTYNLIIDVIRCPQFEEGTKYYSGGVLMDDGYIHGCHFVNDPTGSRKWRWEQAIQPNGYPYELAQYVSHVGIGIACSPYHGTFTRS